MTWDNGRAETAPISGKGQQVHDTSTDNCKERTNGDETASVTSNDFDVRCGFGKFRPDCLQIFNNPKCLLFFLCWYSMVLGFVVNGINNVNTTSVERRFNLSSSKVGLISSAYDISAGILGVLIAFFGSGKNKARWVACAGVVMAFGSAVMSLPHFTTGLYELGEKPESLCSVNGTTDSKYCVENAETSTSSYLYVFILGQMLHGVGGTTIYTVGLALLDDSVPSSSTPLYIGILYGFSILGPGLGYLVGGQFLSWYVDFDAVDSSKLTITPDDPRWVGAWWLAFFVSAFLNLAVAIPLFAYGKELPSARIVRETRVSQAHKDAEAVKARTGYGTPLKDVVRVLQSLLRNPCFCFITLSMVTEGIVIAGSATFLPKFLENEYQLSASWAATLTGMAVVPSAAGGQFLGGFIAQRLKLDIRGSIRLCLVGVVGAFVCSAILWIKCEQGPIIGISDPTSKASLSPGLNQPCNANCYCSTDAYEPACDVNGSLFFSPCHAGCQLEIPGQQGYYTQCGCAGNATLSNSSVATVTTSGCRKSCHLLYVFLALLFVLICFVFLPVAPGDSIQLRCVPEEHKTFAQGVKLLIVRLIGTVPGPVIYGRLLDEACLIWREKCNERLSCWIYDNHTMARNLFLLMIGTCILSGVFCLLALRLYNPPIVRETAKTEENHELEEIMEPFVPKGDSCP